MGRFCWPRPVGVDPEALWPLPTTDRGPLDVVPCRAETWPRAGTCEGCVPVTSMKRLVRMSGPELEQLYRCSPSVALPPGKARVRAIVKPGTRLAVPASTVARAMWQGKVIDGSGTRAVNK